MFGMIVLAVTMVVVVVVVVVMIVIVVVAVAGELEHKESDPGRDQDAADDRVLGVLNRRAKLQPDHDDHRTETDRDEHVRHAGETREARDSRKGVPARAAEDGEWHPVIRQDRVPESNSRRRGEERRPSARHVS
jgi:hypothetical protein